MKINSHSLRISQAKVEIPNELEIGTYDMKVIVTGDIVKQEVNDDQDGGVSVTYVLKASEAEIINK